MEIKKLTQEIKREIAAGSYFTKKALIERGWTEKEIIEFLPLPDLYRNPVNPSGEPMKVWSADDVEEIARSEQIGKYRPI